MCLASENIVNNKINNKRLSGERAIMGPSAKRHLHDVLLVGNFSRYVYRCARLKFPYTTVYSHCD